MSPRESNPPKSAMWLLRHACPGSHNQALTGDLLEKFHYGRSHGWFWKQVLIAIAVGVLGEVRGHWPHFSYAIAGTAMLAFPWKSVGGAPVFLHWWVLPWPWSQLVLELRNPALIALAALPVMGAALVIKGTFRWVSLLRTGMINLALIALVFYLPDVFPWLLRPVAGNPQFGTLMIEPVFVFFSAFLISAWVGCRSPRPANEVERQAKA